MTSQVVLVSSLVRSGLPTKLIIPLLRNHPSAQSPSSVDANLEELFAAELARLDCKMTCMGLSRSAIQEHLERMRSPVHA
ncbi:hypothetical protein ACQEUX_04710 [Micromonospora sp. CA-259024]|uniref:hypothetical protein n=1 Tax=Micromonospora sp. CA-259024 TaxID=3239965 RepID=UPI003D91D543